MSIKINAYYFLPHLTNDQEVIEVDGFGTRGNWQHFNFDIYTLLEGTGFEHIPIYYTFFQVETGYVRNDVCTLLLDDLRYTTYPTGDPGFEEDWYWSAGNPIVSWSGDVDHNYANLTSVAYSGN